MATILSLIRRLEAANFEKIAIASMSESKETLADINVEQMMQGLRADGSEILPSYKPLTIEIKKQKGQPTDRVTLRDTGAFQAATTVDVSGDKITIGSADFKADKLNKKYSTAKGNIHGLGGKFKQRFIDEKLRDVYLKKVREALKL